MTEWHFLFVAGCQLPTTGKLTISHPSVTTTGPIGESIPAILADVQDADGRW